MSAAGTARRGDGTAAQALEGVPIRELLGGLATDLCRAQHDLDLMSVRVTEAMGGARTVVTGEGPDAVRRTLDTRVDFAGERVSLLELGFSPTFLQVTDAVVAIKLSVSLSRDESRERTELSAELGADLASGVHVTAVDARYASRFQYSAEGSSCLTTRLVPIPAPAELVRVVRDLAVEREAPR